MDQSTFKAVTDPPEKSLLRSLHQDRATANTDQGFDSLPSPKLIAEPLAPVGQDWKAKAHTRPVKDELGLAVA